MNGNTCFTAVENIYWENDYFNGSFTNWCGHQSLVVIPGVSGRKSCSQARKEEAMMRNAVLVYYLHCNSTDADRARASGRLCDCR